MSPTEARRLARIGEFYVQEAIMGLLELAPGGLMHGELVRVLGLPDDGHNATVTGQLHRLQEQKKVHQPYGERRQWALTDGERNRRQAGFGGDNAAP